MKRDMDLVRDLLLWMEADPNGRVGAVPTFPGHSDESVGYHFHLMVQAGLIEGMQVRSIGLPSPYSKPLSLTYAGHDFLEHARDNTRWNRAKKSIIETGRSMTVEVLTSVLQSLAGAG